MVCRCASSLRPQLGGVVNNAAGGTCSHVHEPFHAAGGRGCGARGDPRVTTAAARNAETPIIALGDRNPIISISFETRPRPSGPPVSPLRGGPPASVVSLAWA